MRHTTMAPAPQSHKFALKVGKPFPIVQTNPPGRFRNRVDSPVNWFAGSTIEPSNRRVCLPGAPLPTMTAKVPPHISSSVGIQSQARFSVLRARFSVGIQGNRGVLAGGLRCSHRIRQTMFWNASGSCCTCCRRLDADGVEFEGEIYASPEAASQAAKASKAERPVFQRPGLDPFKAKRLGRALSPRPDWDEVKLSVNVIKKDDREIFLLRLLSRGTPAVSDRYSHARDMSLIYVGACEFS
jgi:hypothetical protein